MKYFWYERSVEGARGAGATAALVAHRLRNAPSATCAGDSRAMRARDILLICEPSIEKIAKVRQQMQARL